MIKIIYATISKNNHKRLIENYLPYFSRDFQVRISEFRKWEDAQSSLLGRILLHKGVKKFNKNFNFYNIKYTKYKKPFIEDFGIQFNISHSGKRKEEVQFFQWNLFQILRIY